MWSIRALTLLLGSVIVVCASAYAQQIETTPVPTNPKPDFSKMMFLTGSWTCSVMSARRPRPYQVTSTASIDPDGYWLITHSTVHKTSWIPRSFTTEDRMTYDGSTSRWIDINYDDTGSYDLSTSPGWSGSSITWTDVAYPKTNATATNYPTTMTKVSETKTTSVSSFKEPSGRLVSVKTSCTKNS